MKKVLFLFIASFLLLLQLHQIESEVVSQLIHSLCFLFILTLGIAHGSIDNILFREKSKISNGHFILLYLVVIALNLALWLIHADLALVIFLLFSAYHFGQSQFVKIKNTKGLLIKLLNLSWGISILTALILFNEMEIKTLFTDSRITFKTFSFIVEYGVYILSVSTFLSVILIAFFTYKQGLTINQFFLEVVQLLLIFSTFYLLPVLVGFSLYFVLLHSLEVLGQEFNFLKASAKLKNIKQFARILLPFTLLSVVGLSLILFTFQYFQIDFSISVLLLALGSSITLPHALVMEIFYAKNRIID